MDESLVKELITYIEETELAIEHERYYCRSLEELVENNVMPDIYYKLLILK